MQTDAEQVFARYLRSRPKVDLAVGASYGPEHQYAFLSGAKSPYAGIDRHSLFELGSVSKTFAALLLEKAVIAGFTDMTTPVYELVPELKSAIASSITVQQLAIHTSGLPYDFPYGVTKEARSEDRDPWARLTRNDLYEYLTSAKTGIPGSKWRYSNIGYSVLAIALENIYGDTYPALLQQHVFDPLRMTDSVSSSETVDCATQGHCGNQRSPYSESELLYGPGDIRSSAHDMLRYIDAALYEEQAPYSGFGKYLLAPADDDKPPKVQQGLAWALFDEDPGWLVLASGATSGFSCSVMFSPSRRKGLVVLSNHLDIGGFGDLIKARLWKNSTVQGATQLLYDTI